MGVCPTSPTSTLKAKGLLFFNPDLNWQSSVSLSGHPLLLFPEAHRRLHSCSLVLNHVILLRTTKESYFWKEYICVMSFWSAERRSFAWPHSQLRLLPGPWVLRKSCRSRPVIVHPGAETSKRSLNAQIYSATSGSTGTTCSIAMETGCAALTTRSWTRPDSTKGIGTQTLESCKGSTCAETVTAFDSFISLHGSAGSTDWVIHLRLRATISLSYTLCFFV